MRAVHPPEPTQSVVRFETPAGRHYVDARVMLREADQECCWRKRTLRTSHNSLQGLKPVEHVLGNSHWTPKRHCPAREFSRWAGGLNSAVAGSPPGRVRDETDVLLHGQPQQIAWPPRSPHAPTAARLFRVEQICHALGLELYIGPPRYLQVEADGEETSRPLTRFDSSVQLPVGTTSLPAPLVYLMESEEPDRTRAAPVDLDDPQAFYALPHGYSMVPAGIGPSDLDPVPTRGAGPAGASTQVPRSAGPRAVRRRSLAATRPGSSPPADPAPLWLAQCPRSRFVTRMASEIAAWSSRGGEKIDFPHRSVVDRLVEPNRFEQERAQLSETTPERSLQRAVLGLSGLPVTSSNIDAASSSSTAASCIRQSMVSAG